MPLPGEPVPEQTDLRRLTRAVATLERHEDARCRGPTLRGHCHEGKPTEGIRQAGTARDSLRTMSPSSHDPAPATSARAGDGRSTGQDPRSPGVVFADRTFDAILFDMDGTLINSIPAVERAWRRWAGEFNIADAGSFTLAHGTPAKDLVAQLVPADDVARAFARIVQLELEDTDGIELLAGTARALDQLPADRQAIVTSCTRALALARIAATGLIRPEVLVAADDVSRGKPDPEPFRRGAELLGFDPARCLVVEDAPTGLIAAKAAGCATLAVAGTHDLDELDADAASPDLSHVHFVQLPDGTLTVR